jgi:hypothetical protein
MTGTSAKTAGKLTPIYDAWWRPLVRRATIERRYGIKVNYARQLDETMADTAFQNRRRALFLDCEVR